MPDITEDNEFINMLPQFWNSEVQEHQLFSSTNRRWLLRRVRSVMEVYATDLAPDLAEDIVQNTCLQLCTPGSFHQKETGSLRGYIKSVILNAIHVVRAENTRPGHRTRLVHNKTEVGSADAPFVPKYVELDRTFSNRNGEEVSVGDTVANPLNPIMETIESISTSQTLKAVAKAGYTELATALRLMYDENITLNAASQCVNVHYSTLYRQRLWVTQNYPLITA